MAKRVTLQDVASAAGVSPQTVSRVVNRKPDVAEDTRRRVWQTIHRLGYRPNTLARSLALRRSYALGLISCSVNGTFLARVIMSIEREARANGYLSILAFTEEEPDSLIVVFDLLLERQVDGIMLIGLSPHYDPPCELSLPVVSLAYPLEGEHVINVDVDNVNGAYQAVCHLTDLGHRRIGVVAGPAGWKAVGDRIEGVRRAMAKVGQPLDDTWIEYCAEWSLDAGYVAANALFSRHPDLSAVFCQNDWLALGTYRVLHECGLCIPEDVSVVGYDDSSLCLYTLPALTSVHQPHAELGELLAQLLIASIERGSVSSHDVLLRTEIVVRASTAPWGTAESSLVAPTSVGVRP